MSMVTKLMGAAAGAMLLATGALAQDIAIRAEQLHTMAGPVIEDGVVLIQDGKIVAVGPSQGTPIPEGVEVLEAKVATPGLVDARTVVGLAGYLNQAQDQDQLESSAPLQPELRAIDAYNPDGKLVKWLRGFGVTTLHTGHGPGALVSGQTMVVKTVGRTADAAVIVPQAMVAANLGPWALADGSSSPGTRAKQISLLRQALLDARQGAELEVGDAGDTDDAEDNAPGSSLAARVLRDVLARKTPMLVTANRSQDIMSALRLKEEFGIDLVLDGAAESYLLLDEIRQANVPVILHAPMARQYGELENASFTTGSVLREAGIPFAYQSGYEGYVPKTRVVLFEAAVAAANGLGWNDALASITIDAARVIGLEDRIGSLEVGKDGDVALFDGDPFEYASHTTGVVIDGRRVSSTPQ